MTSKSFSIIIPYYNSNNYIEKALNAITNVNYEQSLIEVLIIDDGSKNDSFEVVNNYCKKYKNIKLFHKPNGQWGSVINYVLSNKLAQKEYIAILDSDDFYDQKIFEILNSMPRSDILVGAFKKFDGKKQIRKVYPFWFLIKRNIHNKQQMSTPFCLPLIFFVRKEVFYQLEKLDKNMAYQDPVYLCQLIKNAKSLFFTKKTIGYYFFNRPNNSISQTWDDKRFKAELNACKKMLKYDNQEMVSCRLNVKAFKSVAKTKNIKFNIYRKFSFKWYPWYIRGFYFLVHQICLKKFFIYNKHD